MKNILRYEIKGSNTILNFIWFLILFFISSYSFTISYSSYVFHQQAEKDINLIISFFPQGLIMGFYSIFGLILSFYICLSLIFKVGSGFNEFNRKERIIRIFRWGFPGGKRRVQGCYSFHDLKSIKISSGSNNIIYISLKGDLDIPLTRQGFFESIELLEQQATNIAKFIGLPLVYN